MSTTAWLPNMFVTMCARSQPHAWLLHATLLLGSPLAGGGIPHFIYRCVKNGSPGCGVRRVPACARVCPRVPACASCKQRFQC